MEEYIGIIKLFGGNFAPRGWMLCDGRLVPIAQYNAVFAILGTTYGGNGSTTFGLPDLRGRAAVGTGQGTGLPNVVLGEVAGSQSVSLLVSNLPAHVHSVGIPASSGAQTTNRATGAYPATGNAYSLSTNTTMATVNSGISGNNIPVSTVSPYLGLTYIICMEGIFPSRN